MLISCDKYHILKQNNSKKILIINYLSNLLSH